MMNIMNLFLVHDSVCMSCRGMHILVKRSICKVPSDVLCLGHLFSCLQETHSHAKEACRLMNMMSMNTECIGMITSCHASVRIIAPIRKQTRKRIMYVCVCVKQRKIYYWSKWKRRNYSRCNRYQKCCVRKLWDQLLKKCVCVVIGHATCANTWSFAIFLSEKVCVFDWSRCLLSPLWHSGATSGRAREAWAQGWASWRSCSAFCNFPHWYPAKLSIMGKHNTLLVGWQ